jgi:hypothetical protein
MRAVDRRRVEKIVVVVSAMVASGACAPASHTTNSAPESFTLVVTNRSDFEVVVYAIPSAGSAGYRLGNARSFATTTMNIPRNALQASEVLVVQLHAIGSSSRLNWTSQDASIDHSVVAQLDIRADGSGNLSHSMLYTESSALSRTRNYGHKQP